MQIPIDYNVVKRIRISCGSYASLLDKDKFPQRPYSIQCSRLDLFINNQLKSITLFFIAFCLQQQAMMWMRGHVVLIE
jgi:hypothetical protein